MRSPTGLLMGNFRLVVLIPLLARFCMIFCVVFAISSHAASVKKGLCGRSGATGINKMNVAWYYTWGGVSPINGANAEYVPLFFGWDDVTSANLAKVELLKTSSGAKYVMGFNEPERPDQGNTTVAQAITQWPKLMALNLPLLSPAPAVGADSWLTDFMKQADALKYRVDLIGEHSYIITAGSTEAASAPADNFIARTSAYYNKFKKPLWVTEIGDSRIFRKTSVMVDNFWFLWHMLPRLDSLSFVERYALYSGAIGENHNFVDAAGDLTIMGVLYKTYDKVPKLLKTHDYATLSSYAQQPDLLALGMELMLVPQLANAKEVARVADDWLWNQPDSIKYGTAGLAIAYFGGKAFLAGQNDQINASKAFKIAASRSGEYQQKAQTELAKLPPTLSRAISPGNSSRHSRVDAYLPRNGNVPTRKRNENAYFPNGKEALPFRQ